MMMKIIIIIIVVVISITEQSEPAKQFRKHPNHKFAWTF